MLARIFPFLGWFRGYGMGLVSRLRPQFWTATDDTGPYRSLFNYRRIWWLSVALLAAVSLAPLCIMLGFWPRASSGV